jgi:Ca2+-binding RTX toxin-like protein
MQRRGVLLLTSIVVMVVVGAGVALAANISCAGGGKGCLGTNQADVITGSSDIDIITAAGSADTVNAAGSADEVYGDSGGDTLNGGNGNDYLEGGRGDNVARGQAGDFDVVNVVDGDGNDFASGGDGENDVCIIDVAAEDNGSAVIFGGEDAGADDVSDSCDFRFAAFDVTPL